MTSADRIKRPQYREVRGSAKLAAHRDFEPRSSRPGEASASIGVGERKRHDETGKAARSSAQRSRPRQPGAADGARRSAQQAGRTEAKHNAGRAAEPPGG